VLGINYCERLSTPSVRGTWNFAVARFARIYPLYLAILVFVAVPIVAGGGSTAGLGLHLAGLQAWSPSLDIAFGFNGPAWSLSVELFLYACFPLLVLLLGPLRRPAALLIALAVAVGAVFLLAYLFVRAGRDRLAWEDPSSAHRWLYVMPVTRLGDFTAGILLARLYLTVGHHPRVLRSGRWFAWAGGAAAVGLMSWSTHLYSAWSWDASYLVPALAIIWGLAVAGSASWLSTRVMVAAGSASYAFYLIHQRTMRPLGANRLRSVEVTGWVVIAQITTFLLVMALAVGLSQMIEQPARRFITRYASVRGRPSRAGESAPRGDG
jgi:peptidoglycan/LPS O-acetylase OafA/YrhL